MKNIGLEPLVIAPQVAIKLVDTFRKKNLTKQEIEKKLDDFLENCGEGDLNLNNSNQNNYNQLLESNDSNVQERIRNKTKEMLSKDFQYCPIPQEDSIDYKSKLESNIAGSIGNVRRQLRETEENIAVYKSLDDYVTNLVSDVGNKLPEELEGRKVTKEHRDFISEFVGNTVSDGDFESWVSNTVNSMEEDMESREGYLEQLKNISGISDEENVEGTSSKVVGHLYVEAAKEVLKEDARKAKRYCLEKLVFSSKNGLLEEEKDGNYNLNVSRKREIEFGHLRSLGFNINPIVEGRSYVIGSTKGDHVIFPRNIREKCLGEYLEYCKGIADPQNEREQKKLEFARAILEKDLDFNIGEHVGCLFKDVRKGLVDKAGKIKEDKKLRDVLENLGIQDLRKIALDELQTLLQSKEQNTGENDQVHLMNSVLRRYKPEIYEKNMDWTEQRKSIKERSYAHRLFEPLGNNICKFFGGLIAPLNHGIIDTPVGLAGILYHGVALPHRAFRLNRKSERIIDIDNNLPWGNRSVKKYKIFVTNDPKTLQKAAKSTHTSCIKDNGLEYFKEVTDDYGTVFLVGKQDGEIVGYSRLFLMHDSNDNSRVIVSDTIEPPGKEFYTYEGLVNAFGLATIQLALDMNVDFVIGDDSRIRCGPRQAYSSVKKRVKLKKIGRVPRTTYTININKNGEYESSSYVLMENWK